ncbi:hypothetical protein HBI42_044790 [Parastagonospora nodorum]|nr:hypothetical protein HBI76_065170 [Parastagonospora nodorum]KAH5277703.1 hypothetical protein HBI72_032780 [Parastagonospora nodorum]KAH6048441.1 hypothetical protein HBI54_065100 [Parastagonospora nodorum]KAH6268369.1 hypothetical protein HBI42_044790 [Parastagonospora nodorum]
MRTLIRRAETCMPTRVEHMALDRTVGGPRTASQWFNELLAAQTRLGGFGRSHEPESIGSGSRANCANWPFPRPPLQLPSTSESHRRHALTTSRSQ